MSPKNAIKIINIKKFYSVNSILFNLLWFYLVHLGPIRSIPSTLLLFYPLQSYSLHIGPMLFCSLRSSTVNIGPIQSTSVLFSPTWSYSILFVPIRSIMSTLVQICLFVLIRSTSIPLNPFQYTLVHCPIRSILVPFSPPCSYSTLFCPFGPLHFIWSNSIHLYPSQSIQTTSVRFGLLWSIFLY